MGGFSVFHWLIVLGVFVLPLALILIAVLAAGKGGLRAPKRTSDLAPTAGSTAQVRLQQLAELQSKGLLSTAEFHSKRKEILDSI